MNPKWSTKPFDVELVMDLPCTIITKQIE